MKPLRLQVYPEPSITPFGWLALTVSAIIFLCTASFYLWLESERRAIEPQLVAQRLSLLPPTNKRKFYSSKEMTAASAAIAQLAAPWDRTFTLIERTLTSDVAYLQISPDPLKGTLSITAEARNVAAMLAYFGGISGRDDVDRATLMNHQVVTTNQISHVRFAVSIVQRSIK